MHLIRFKGIQHNVLNDAPFIGAVLIAKACHRGCSGCINDHLKKTGQIYAMSSEEIMDQVMNNKLNQGIILSGLEWSEQGEDLLELIGLGLRRKLKVMVYTHLEEEDFLDSFPSLKKAPIYIKFGAYLPAYARDGYYSHGVQLASSNQVIKYFGKIKEEGL